jgi:hypothetical protein
MRTLKPVELYVIIGTINERFAKSRYLRRKSGGTLRVERLTPRHFTHWKDEFSLVAKDRAVSPKTRASLCDPLQ